MDNIKNDKYYAQEIIYNINIVQDYVKDKTYDEFISDN